MKEKLKILSIIHLSLCVVLIFVYYFLGKDYLFDANFKNVAGADFFYISLPFIAFYLSQFLFQNQLKNISASKSIDDNYMVYQTASIMRWAIIEGSAFAILFICPEFIYLGVLLIIYLLTIRPTET